MIKFSDITAHAKTAVTGNAALKAWCLDKFGKTPKIYLGMDVANPPKEEDCPFICFTVTGRTAGMEAGQKTFELIVTFGLTCTDVEKDVNGGETLLGCAMVGDYWELIWQAMYEGFSSNVFLSQEDTTIDGITTFPLFVGASQIVISYATMMGGDLSL